MKKLISTLPYLLFALTLFLPCGVILTACFGYSFELTSYSVFAIISALSAIASAVLLTVSKANFEKKSVSVLLALISPLSFVNTWFYIFKCRNIFVAACMLICVCCCCYLTARYSKPLTLKITALTLSGLMVMPTVIFGFMAILPFGKNTVTNSATSPNGTYYAEVIDSDQGALGGDTLVRVYKKGINLLVFKISKSPQTVYHGEWGEAKNMSIRWKDDNCLLINSVEYTIK